MLVYVCKAVKNGRIPEFQILTCNAWSDNICHAREYINQRPDIDYKLIAADVKNINDIYKIFIEDVICSDEYQPCKGDTYNGIININDYKIEVYSTDTIHPQAVYATNEQITNFEISVCETNSLESDIDEFGCGLYRINLLSRYLLNNDDMKSVLTKLFAKYIVFDMLGDGYYGCYAGYDEDPDEMYIKYKKFADRIDLDLDSASIYEFYDQMAYYDTIINRYNSGVV